MASRKELEVGQVRELRHPSTGRYANTNRARCQILALDQKAEMYSRGDGSYAGSGYRVHEDMALVAVAEQDQHGWRFDSFSSLQTNKKPGAELDRSDVRFTRTGSQRYEHVELPKGQYLVKPKLLGPIWDEEEKAAQAKAEAIGRERKRQYDAAVRAQDERLQGILTAAGVSSTKWTGGHQWRLSSNDLALVIESVSLGEVEPGLVHWKDYQDLEVEV